jgi:hypothetical protein
VLEFGSIAVTGFDILLVNSMQRKELHTEQLKVLSEGLDCLIVEFGASTREEAWEKGHRLAKAFERLQHAEAKLITNRAMQCKIWQVAEVGLSGSAYPDRPEAWEGLEDTAVPREHLRNYLRAPRALYDRYGYRLPMYGHFGDGLVDCRVFFDLKHEDGIRSWSSFLDEAADLVVNYDGSLSGEHGDGQARAAQMSLGSMGFFLSYTSWYFAWQSQKRRQQQGWVKWAFAMWVGPQILLSQRVRSGPCGNFSDLEPLATMAAAIMPFEQLLANAGYDSESSHRLRRASGGAVMP